MKKTIYKYLLDITDVQTINIPYSGVTPTITYVGLDPYDRPCVWVEVNDTCLCPVTFYVVGTGNPIPAEANRHVGSVRIGPCMWHIYI